MFGSVLDKATGFLDKRFVLNLLLPTLAFWGALVLLAAQGASWEGSIEWWEARSAFEQVLLIGAVITGLFVSAFIASGQLVALTRLWEGYWPGGRNSRLAAWRIRQHTDTWKSLDLHKDEDYMRRYYSFPISVADVVPTRLGNVLRAAEDYAGDDERYGADAVFYWPRLYLVLPTDTRTLVEDYRSGLDRMVLVASLAVAFPFAGLLVLAFAHTSWLSWAASAAAALLVAWLAYESALNAAVAFGDVIRACFDLYRRSLMKQYGLALPTSLEEERAQWVTLKQQLYQRGADDLSMLVWTAGDNSTTPAMQQRRGPLTRRGSRSR